ncbi:MAG: succinate dehydrogenase/fumarate reductase iron-sulfur subunit, partial [Gemmatimonadetes bacterium]|nr:succinate dehydrogenase/fumarate reductase iron-sulfur subunit [Gemmatimonadota bacterium]
MKLKLHVWRQASPAAKGGFVEYEADANEHMSFLEMLDVLNERLESQGEEPIVFDHDCREGICGTCGMVINGRPHGPWERTTVCQLHMREYNDGDQVWIEPWRAKGFPVLRDLFVDRTALDRIVQAGGFVSANCGGAPDANAIPVNR